MKKIKILITGMSGFVGWHFLNYLEDEKISAEILGIDHTTFHPSRAFKSLEVSSADINLLEREKIKKILKEFRPDYILHLASFSSVAYSWQHPIESFQNNTNIFLNLVESVQESDIKTRILSVGSSEEYGNLSKKDLPVRETHSLNPLSPYAVARVSQEMLSRVFVSNYNSDIVMTRSFNHIGERQKDAFVVSSFARQLIEIKLGKHKEHQILTGDISIVRDFVDVRDVVAAYYKLLLTGKKGEMYNICSGTGTSLKDIILKMAKILNLDIKIIIDKNLLRPNDNKIIIGSNSKIKKETGWANKISLDTSLRDILSYWEKELSK